VNVVWHTSSSSSERTKRRKTTCGSCLSAFPINTQSASASRGNRTHSTLSSPRAPWRTRNRRRNAGSTTSRTHREITHHFSGETSRVARFATLKIRANSHVKTRGGERASHSPDKQATSQVFVNFPTGGPPRNERSEAGSFPGKTRSRTPICIFRGARQAPSGNVRKVLQCHSPKGILLRVSTRKCLRKHRATLRMVR